VLAAAARQCTPQLTLFGRTTRPLRSGTVLHSCHRPHDSCIVPSRLALPCPAYASYPPPPPDDCELDRRDVVSMSFYPSTAT
jgi:hypothetical protein